jgi:hypothetical protein
MKIIYFILILICFASCKQLSLEKKVVDLPDLSSKQKKCKQLHDIEDFYKKFEELIISEGKIFKQIEPNEILEYNTVYLGNVDNLNMGKLDFIYSVVYSGHYWFTDTKKIEYSKHANPRNAIYNNNKRLGHYYTGWAFTITPIILNDELIISYNEDEGCNQTTRISFKDSIPQMIFIHCKEENGKMYGDIYNFEKEK